MTTLKKCSDCKHFIEGRAINDPFVPSQCGHPVVGDIARAVYPLDMLPPAEIRAAVGSISMRIGVCGPGAGLFEEREPALDTASIPTVN